MFRVSEKQLGWDHTDSGSDETLHTRERENCSITAMSFRKRQSLELADSDLEPMVMNIKDKYD